MLALGDIRPIEISFAEIVGQLLDLTRVNGLRLAANTRFGHGICFASLLPNTWSKGVQDETTQETDKREPRAGTGRVTDSTRSLDGRRRDENRSVANCHRDPVLDATLIWQVKIPRLFLS